MGHLVLSNEEEVGGSVHRSVWLMGGSRKFCQRASKFDVFFLVDEGIENPNIAINGPSLAHQ